MHEKINSGEVTVWKIWYQNNLFQGDVCVCVYIYTYIHMRGEIRRRRPNSCLPSRRLVENHEGIRRGTVACARLVLRAERKIKERRRDVKFTRGRARTLSFSKRGKAANFFYTLSI